MKFKKKKSQESGTPKLSLWCVAYTSTKKTGSVSYGGNPSGSHWNFYQLDNEPVVWNTSGNRSIPGICTDKPEPKPHWCLKAFHYKKKAVAFYNQCGGQARLFKVED
jgi:hypothetical protein